MPTVTSSDLHKPAQSGDLQGRNQELAQELVQLKTLLNSLPLGICRIAPDGSLLFANRALAHLLDCADHNDLVALARELRRQSIECAHQGQREHSDPGREMQEFTRELRTSTGRTLYVRERICVTRDLHTGMPLYCDCTLEDITDQHRAEAALRASEERYRSLVEHSPIGILLLDEQMHVIYVNAETCHILGHSREEIIAHSFTEFLPSDTTIDLPIPGPQTRERQRSRISSRQEIPIIRGDGETRRVVLETTTYRNPAGHIRTIVQIGDITKRIRTEQALRDYARELEVRNAELDTFADYVAHDLRNPLSSIIGFSDILANERDTLPPERVDQSLQLIVKMGYKMSTIIDALLLFARVRKATVRPEPIHMAPVVESALQRLQQALEARQAEVHQPTHWPMALGYGPWVEEVWFNYLSNALNYGGSPPHIVLGADLLAGDTQVRFWVRDNGDGIPPEVQAHIFEMFAAPGGRQARGHGIGLALVKRIVEKLGGTVAVESSGQPGEGSTFSFTLPAATLATTQSSPVQIKTHT